MSRHPRLPAALLAAALFGTACSAATGEELTAPTLDTTTTTVTTAVANDATTRPATGTDDSSELEGHDVAFAVATAIEFLEESETVATATPEQVEEILAPYLHSSAPTTLLGDVLASTEENQDLGLSRWRHAVLEIRVEELSNGDVVVEGWQVAVITLDPDRGPSRAAAIWATDTLTLTYTHQGWKITDRVVQSGPTPEPSPAVIPDDAELLETRLDGFADAHQSKGR